MSDNLILDCKQFVKKSFQENPNYSFNDWEIMYNHSLKVMEIAILISDEIESDKELVALGALLHDIGKTSKETNEVLYKTHEDLNVIMAEKFISESVKNKTKAGNLRKILHFNNNSIEEKIIKDADALAMYVDKKLRLVWVDWALKNNHSGDIQRKLNKFDNLNFEISKKIGKSWYLEAKEFWYSKM